MQHRNCIALCLFFWDLYFTFNAIFVAFIFVYLTGVLIIIINFKRIPLYCFIRHKVSYNDCNNILRVHSHTYEYTYICVNNTAMSRVSFYFKFKNTKIL